MLETSEGAQRFAEQPQEFGAGKDVRLGFPELIGSENYLMAVFEGQRSIFEFVSLGRGDNNFLYFNLYVILQEKTEDNLSDNLIIFLEDVTERIILEQNLVQATNGTNLLVSALSESKYYIDKIIDSMADALLVTTTSGKIKIVNKAVEGLFGYSESELIGQQISMIIDDKNFFKQANQQPPLFANKFKNVEAVCQTKAGKKISVAFSCSVIQTDVQDLQNFVYIGRDITQRKRDQQRQVAQYATTRVLSESTALNKAIQKILPALCESLSWDLGEFWMVEEGSGEEGRGEYLPSGQLRCVESWARALVGIKEFIESTKKITFAPGVGLPGRVWASRSPLWISDVVNDAKFERSHIASRTQIHGAFGFPIQSGGEIFGVMTFFSREKQIPDEDLLQMMMAIGSQLGQFIQSKRAEAAQLESEERYRDLFENANDLIQSVAPDGNFLYVNHAWRETLGYSEAEIAQIKVFDVIHPDCLEQCLEKFQRVMSGEKIGQIKVEFITKNGEKISLEGSVNCKLVNGKPVATRAILRDITERLAAEEALRYQQEQTERLLLNILPQPIAKRLKRQENTIAENFSDVTVMFADLVGFTEFSTKVSPTELVEILNVIFSEFDQLAEQHGLEKIKTIGDAYMVVGGIPHALGNHASAIAQMALDMQTAIAQFSRETGQALSMRIGIHTGPVVAGVIGTKGGTR
ncbi:PAS domain S-box protein [Trichocoleus sp. FACHB-832]|uniref:PAS domain S-box protein n=1 Tax=Trichocoleus sp. FACHB-832 TaxID=2692875 RepID=UPI0018EFD851